MVRHASTASARGSTRGGYPPCTTSTNRGTSASDEDGTSPAVRNLLQLLTSAREHYLHFRGLRIVHLHKLPAFGT